MLFVPMLQCSAAVSKPLAKSVASIFSGVLREELGEEVLKGSPPLALSALTSTRASLCLGEATFLAFMWSPGATQVETKVALRPMWRSSDGWTGCQSKLPCLHMCTRLRSASKGCDGSLAPTAHTSPMHTQFSWSIPKDTCCFPIPGCLMCCVQKWRRKCQPSSARMWNTMDSHNTYILTSTCYIWNNDKVKVNFMCQLG